MSSETELPPPADDAFADVTALIRLIIDPKACQARLDAFTAASTKIRDEHTAPERAYKARAARHERREAGRQRPQGTGEPVWRVEDRHLRPAGERTVGDVAPGTPGHFGSVHTSRDD